MADTQLPLPQDLALPTLRAVVALGGSATYAEIDDRTLEIAGISAEQKSVMYGPDATATGPKILHRIAWARSILKRIGALESAGKGKWASTPYGAGLAAKPDAEARAEIDAAVSVAYETVEPSESMLTEFRESAEKGSPASMTVRELIALWGVSRRRVGVVEKVTATLNRAGLVAVPNFTVGGLDTSIFLVSNEVSGPTSQPQEGVTEETGSGSQAVSLVVGNIPSATGGIKSVNPQHDLLYAQSVMQANDFSQLAVMNGQYHLAGAVSWESIANALFFNKEAELSDCIDENPKVVRPDQPLLDAVPDISDSGFVFVKDASNKIVGIVTPADLSEQFAVLTRPFLLLGEIERLLRVAINRSFTVEYLYEALNPDDERELEDAGSLTLGEIQRLLEHPPSFAELGWRADRKVFIRKLDAVRSIRNEVMHFSPDPVEDSALAALQTFVSWVGLLESQVQPAIAPLGD